MRKIIGLIIGLIISIAIFVPFWFQAAKVYRDINEGFKRHCAALEECQRCNLDFTCLKKGCDSGIFDNCNYIDQNFNIILEMDALSAGDYEQHFVIALCGRDPQNRPECAAPIESGLAIFFRSNVLFLALHYTALFFGIGQLFILVSWATKVIGFLILLFPVILGFFIGLWLDLIKTNKNKNFKI